MSSLPATNERTEARIMPLEFNAQLHEASMAQLAFMAAQILYSQSANSDWIIPENSLIIYKARQQQAQGDYIPLVYH